MIAVEYSAESVDESYFILPPDIKIQEEDDKLKSAQKIIKSMLE